VSENSEEFPTETLFIRTYLLQEIAAPEERHQEAQHDHWNCCFTEPQS